VAVKALARGSASDLERFTRELRMLRTQITNRHVVDVLDWDLGHDPPYLVMEFCEGGPLRAWVGKKPPWRSVAVALAHAINGLHGLHRADGFHRDIKPDNLLMGKDSATGEMVVKVADFGLARAPVTATGPMTRSAMGTPGYIAPEVLAGAPYAASADIYSLGV